MRVSDQSSQYMRFMQYGAKSSVQSAQSPAAKNRPMQNDSANPLSAEGNTQKTQGMSDGRQSGIQPPVGRFLDIYV